MKRVVVDTGVFVSGIYWTTESHQVLQAWLRGAFTWIMTEEIWTEYVEVAWRVKIAEGLAHNPEVWLERIQALSQWVTPSDLGEPIGTDSDDQMFFRAAIGGSAMEIVARDRHFTRMDRPLGIRIHTPRSFLAMLPRVLRRKS